VTGRIWRKQRLALCVPAYLTEVEKKAFEDAFMMADVREMTLSERTFAETDWERLSEYTKSYDIYVELVSDYYSCEYFS
jgi:phage terminase small subunit